jgi:hypothetical protein
LGSFTTALAHSVEAWNFDQNSSAGCTAWTPAACSAAKYVLQNAECLKALLFLIDHLRSRGSRGSYPGGDPIWKASAQGDSPQWFLSKLGEQALNLKIF